MKSVSSRPGSSYPGIRTSKIDVDAKPVYEANGKPITEIDMDAGQRDQSLKVYLFQLLSDFRLPRGR